MDVIFFSLFLELALVLRRLCLDLRGQGFEKIMELNLGYLA